MPTKTYAYTIFVDWKGHVQVYTLESKACPYEVYQMLNDARKDELFFYMDDHIFDPECIASVVLESETYDEGVNEDLHTCFLDDTDGTSTSEDKVGWVPFFYDFLNAQLLHTLQWLRKSYILNSVSIVNSKDSLWYVLQFDCIENLKDFLKSTPSTLRQFTDTLLLPDRFQDLGMRVNLDEIPIVVTVDKNHPSETTICIKIEGVL